jgi:CRP/FNR family cyclic AMP-dependent transcriptional regulator
MGEAANPQSFLQTFLSEVFACGPDVAQSIARRARERHYLPRAQILTQGERAEATFLLVSGRARALLYSFAGQVVLLHEFAPGDFFGAVASGEPEPETADIVAIEELRALAFLAADFVRLIEAHGCVGLVVSRMLLRQLRATTERMAARTTLSATGRVHAELLRLAREGDGRTLRPAPVFTELAVRVNSTRETVSRTISALERRGILRRDGDALVIVAPARLEEMVV